MDIGVFVEARLCGSMTLWGMREAIVASFTRVHQELQTLDRVGHAHIMTTILRREKKACRYIPTTPVFRMCEALDCGAGPTLTMLRGGGWGYHMVPTGRSLPNFHGHIQDIDYVCH